LLIQCQKYFFDLPGHVKNLLSKYHDTAAVAAAAKLAVKDAKMAAMEARLAAAGRGR
jgi:hypothetical protein